MAQIQRVLTDVPDEKVALNKSILEEDGFTVVVTKQADGLNTLTGTKDDDENG
jgi:hypothetical protein